MSPPRRSAAFRRAASEQPYAEAFNVRGNVPKSSQHLVAPIEADVSGKVHQLAVSAISQLGERLALFGVDH
jgi:hypothetical protein